MTENLQIYETMWILLYKIFPGVELSFLSFQILLCPPFTKLNIMLSFSISLIKTNIQWVNPKLRQALPCNVACYVFMGLFVCFECGWYRMFLKSLKCLGSWNLKNGILIDTCQIQQGIPLSMKLTHQLQGGTWESVK